MYLLCKQLLGFLKYIVAQICKIQCYTGTRTMIGIRASCFRESRKGGVKHQLAKLHPVAYRS